MIRFYINVDWTPTPETLVARKKTEGATKTKFLSFCMHATGIFRLFEQETIKEFFYRLAVIFKTFGIMPKFFTDDILVDFEHDGKNVQLNLEDVIEHFGMEIADSSKDLIKREEWIRKIGDFWKQACIGAAVSGFPLIDKKLIEENKYKIGTKKPTFDEESDEHAELLATEAIKTIGEEPFNELSLRIEERKRELQERRLALAVKPKHVFDYSAIPINVKKRFFKQVFGAPAYKFKTDFAEVVNSEDSYLCSLIHLAWLWANGYVTVEKIGWGNKCAYNAEVDPRMDFDYDKYDGLNKLGFGINIFDSFHDYGLDKLSYLLREKSE